MSESVLVPVPEAIAKAALVNEAQYLDLYKSSIADPDAFWAEHGKRIDWIKPFTAVKDVSFDPHDVHIRWFHDGTLNVSVNCLDRHLETRGDQTAILWEGDDPKDDARITYRDLYERVCKLANAFRELGVKKGDRVCIYLPMIPEAAVAMLACARIGAVHSIVFGGFSPDSLANRIQDSECTLVITSDEGLRGGRKVALKKNVDTALEHCPSVKTVVVVKRTGGAIDTVEGRDVWYHEITANQPAECQPEEMNAEDPLFILYTSGSTGKPKGVLHTSGGYLVYVSMTHEYVFDYKDGEVYWCTADVGWVTGHSYIVYGPLANGAISLMFEGVPNYPDVSRFWQVVEKHKVNIFYTAPTAIRALMREGEEPVKKHDRSSLRILGSVGEPINPEAWTWYHRVVGEDRCPIVDTWWQTETGGILITPLPGATKLKPGSATLPFFGVEPVLVDAEGNELSGATEGNLCIARSWPGQMRTVYGDHERFVQTYFSTYKGYYFTGDGCRRDEDGYYWITGRVDDVINVSGHRMGTAEIESALVAHPKVAEAAVVGFPHDIKGQGIYAYVTLVAGEKETDALRKELVAWVRKDIGPIASPDIIQWAPGLPKTRSGKIMRRILRKIAENEFGALGDTSTLADPTVVEDLIANRPQA
ncbi:acetate--CoA ligase [Rhodospirillum rubrum]|uniref:Acetyl-coenzyme A synthetase n=1 Tax=Rhodospirillum rubrum (strain ATCC 11170 / ATH 1.1.1 / DSM 467 / LMG 4362 / NCIMB 8255 / S1) TaxID=269796 RepID=Q2RNC6_RHORT|nr:acetate--CoA ligase [Rhodospirillum rubrum]ABC24369.1 acetyl-coenzyme A synthetase [Rhodospirillum rubrum ATCC 11170]AEO50120.1 acetyl-coenzyme A synthetase [Rhodospirillum rubrum F11]MBK5956091.1 acetyl-coenzyme A synthetase [Rhodospirillum rubrum]QXG80294.1 acetate--CoA ligase [Rhodospirillum rubrum]HAQ01009.1 acetate--CoA ligase [Rhodospirillum rubrum]